MNEGLKGFPDRIANGPPPLFSLLKTSPGLYIHQAGIGLSTATMTANQVYFIEMRMAEPARFDAIGISVSGTAGAKVNFGRYALDRNGVPTRLERYFGQLTTAGTGVQTISVDVALDRGSNYLALQVDNTAATVFNTVNSPLNNEPAASASAWVLGYLVAAPGSFGLPGTATPSTAPISPAPMLVLRCAP